MAAKKSATVQKIAAKPGFVSPYKQITDAILTQLNAGVAPWAKPWSADGATVSLAAGFPVNFTTRKAYRGVNVWMALLACQENGWKVPAFATFKQIAEAGGTVRKGSKATRVFWMNTIERDPKTPEEAAKVNENGKFLLFILKGYSVFNISQVEGIELGAEVMNALPTIPTDTAELVDALGADVRHGGAEAFYAPGPDFVAMPTPESFNGIEHYKATLFHELTHWTGADHRLNRLEKGARFGNQLYAYEELVAELGAAFLCMEFGVAGDLRHAGYIANWIKLLTDHEQAFYRAAADAQKALDWIRKTAGQGGSAEEADAAEEGETVEMRMAA